MADNESREGLPLSEILLRTPDMDQNQWQSLSWINRWLVMVRAVVLILTVMACAVGILAALADGVFYIDRAIALIIGLTFAHATNNLLNDLIDHRKSIDKDNYFRSRYGVHVLENNFVSNTSFLLITILTGCVAVGCGLYLIVEIGSTILILTVVGAFFVVFYTWPLKHIALGELSVLLVWGPLLVGGSYYVMTESLTPEVMMLSIVYGIGPTLVIMGKHLDKYNDDKHRHISSLPVLIGQDAARYLTIALLVTQWGLLLVLVMTQPAYWLLFCLVCLPGLLKFIRCFREPPPAAKPETYPNDVWPLWYSAFAFRYTRDFGILLLLGLVAGLIV